MSQDSFNSFFESAHAMTDDSMDYYLEELLRAFEQDNVEPAQSGKCSLHIYLFIYLFI
jgi:hypothetical protein